MQRLGAYLERHVVLAAFAAFALIGGLVRVADYTKPLGSDPAQFLYVGETVGQGGMPYADAAFNKGPLTALLFAVVDPLVGTSPSAVRLSVLPFAALAALAVAGYVARHAGRAAGALAGLACAALSGIGSFEGAEAKTEQYGVAPVFGALWLATRGSSAAAGGAGLLMGCAALINPALAVALPAVALELWLGTPRGIRARRFGSAALGGLAPVAAASVWLAAGGALDDALTQIAQQVEETSASLSGAGGASRPEIRPNLPASGLWVMAFAGCAVAARGPRLRGAALAMALMLGAVLLRVKLSHYEFNYHYYPAVPAMAGAIALAVASLWPPRPADRIALSVLVFAFPVGAVVLSPQAELLRLERAERLPSIAMGEPVADFLRERTAPDERVFVAGGRAELYWRAERRAPTRFFDVHGPASLADRAEQGRDLARDPPAAVAVVAPDRLDRYPDLKRLVDERGYVLAYDSAGSRVWLAPRPR